MFSFSEFLKLCLELTHWELECPSLNADRNAAWVWRWPRTSCPSWTRSEAKTSRRWRRNAPALNTSCQRSRTSCESLSAHTRGQEFTSTHRGHKCFSAVNWVHKFKLVVYLQGEILCMSTYPLTLGWMSLYKLCLNHRLYLRQQASGRNLSVWRLFWVKVEQLPGTDQETT